MAVCSKEIVLDTQGENHIIDITNEVGKRVSDSGLRDGIVCVFVAGSTAAITTLEFEPGLLEDLPAALERIAPSNGEYEHHLRWQDGNGHSHVRSAILGPSLTVPFKDGQPILGTWQQIVFIEMDVRPRHRQIIVQMIGE